MEDDGYKARLPAVMSGWFGGSFASPGERYASLAYERLVRSVWEELGSGSAAARAVHETAKRMIMVRLEKSIMGWTVGNDQRCLGGKMSLPRRGLSLVIF